MHEPAPEHVRAKGHPGLRHEEMAEAARRQAHFPGDGVQRERRVEIAPDVRNRPHDAFVGRHRRGRVPRQGLHQALAQLDEEFVVAITRRAEQQWGDRIQQMIREGGDTLLQVTRRERASLRSLRLDVQEGGHRNIRRVHLVRLARGDDDAAVFGPLLPGPESYARRLTERDLNRVVRVLGNDRQALADQEASPGPGYEPAYTQGCGHGQAHRAIGRGTVPCAAAGGRGAGVATASRQAIRAGQRRRSVTAVRGMALSGGCVEREYLLTSSGWRPRGYSTITAFW